MGRVILTFTKGGPGSGHRGHRGRPGKIGGSLPGSGVGALTDADRHTLIQGVKSVGKELFGSGYGGFIWEDDDPYVGEMTPGASLALWEDAGILGDMTAEGEDIYTELPLTGSFDYNVVIDLSTGKAESYESEIGGIEQFTWKDVNDFYKNNSGKLLVNYSTEEHSIHIFRSQSYDPDARDWDVYNTFYSGFDEHVSNKPITSVSTDRIYT